ncbi:MAG: DNA-processing protein DprA, partial [Sporomusa sp.]
TQKFAHEFSDAGILVVSGLAWGIDSHSLIGALKGSGNVVGVLAFGSDVVYPKQNARLFDQVLERGCLLGEYPPGTSPLKHHFPMRNRILSGLTAATIMMEGSTKSGALITVNCALEQGREVFVFPSNIFEPVAQGSNALLRVGANLLLDVQDVADTMGWGDLSKNKPPQHQQKMVLDEQQRKIVECLKNGIEDMQSLCDTLEHTPQKLLYHLTLLELSGIIKQLPGNRWSLVYQ